MGANENGLLALKQHGAPLREQRVPEGQRPFPYLDRVKNLVSLIDEINEPTLQSAAKEELARLYPELVRTTVEWPNRENRDALTALHGAIVKYHITVAQGA